MTTRRGLKLRMAAAAALASLPMAACGQIRVVTAAKPREFRVATVNLGFEDGRPGDGTPPGYWAGKTNAEYGYEIGVDGKVKRSGRQSAYIEFKRRGRAVWGAFNQDFKGQAFAGKVVTVEGWIKTQGADPCEVCARPNHNESTLPEDKRAGAQFRLLAYGAGSCCGESETLLTPIVSGTSEWTVFRARTKVPLGTTQLTLASILWGRGKAWFDDIVLSTEEG